MNNMRQLIENSCKTAVSAAHPTDDDCALMPGGRNGPYLDIESPVRNTAHWLTSFSIAFHLTGKEVFRDTGLKLANWLLSQDDYILNGQVVHRQKAPKDWCNGVIGQAWVAEGLWYAGKLLGISEATDAAVRLVSALPFDEGLGAWIRVDPLQGQMGPDFTFNHQSWFASVAAEVGAEEPKLRDNARRFLDVSDAASFDVDSNGLIKHAMQNRPRAGAGLSPSRVAARLVRRFQTHHRPQINPLERKVGYHLYDLYTLARLRAEFPQHSLWNTDKLRRAVEYAASEEFFVALDNNHYSYPYNAPGFEYPLVAAAFSDIEPSLSSFAERALATQMDKTFCQGTGFFSVGTYDPLTLAARVYELALAIYHD